jgi:thiosulfate reductase cytochrome b subunit
VTGHWRDFLPVGRRSFWRDFAATLRFRLPHRLGDNAVQKVFYWGALAAIAVMILSRLAIWKPVLTCPVDLAVGGFQGVRPVHLLMMTAIVLFWVVHVIVVVLVPRTFVAMVIGRAPAPAHDLESEDV